MSNDTPGDLAKIVTDMAQIGAMLMEDRLAIAMRIAGITTDDIKSGRASMVKAVDNHDTCGRSGVIRQFDSVKHTITVEICPCLEIRIIKRIESPL